MRPTLDEIAACVSGYDPNALPVDRAREFIARLVPRVQTIESVPIRSALGRVLARDVVSPIDVPSHDNSAMDGFALRGMDVAPAHATRLPIAGTGHAGQQFAGLVPPGHCVRIMSGAWLACALAQYACRRGHSALYLRVPRLAEQLRVLHGSGGFGKWPVQLAKTDVVILDDWGVGSLDPSTRSDLLEIIDDRAAHKDTVITTQLPVDHWHAWIAHATIADAILDRVLQRVHRVELAGESLRKPAANASAKKTLAKDRGETSPAH